MSPSNQVKGIALMALLILTGVSTIIISASKTELSSEPAFAKQQTETALGITTTPAVSVTPTATPTLLRVKNQDVPLSVKGETQETAPSYLYTELTSIGVVGNISDRGASMYWLTEAPQQTFLRYGISSSSLNRQATGLTPTYLHEAKLTNLSPNTVYYYTGHAPVIESLTTPASLHYATLSRKITGTFNKSAGSCMVRISMSNKTQTSSYAIATSNTSAWQVEIGNLRTSDLNAYFVPSGEDEVLIDALCVSSGKILHGGAKSMKFSQVMGTSVTILLAREN